MWRFSGRISNESFPFEDMPWPVTSFYYNVFIHLGINQKFPEKLSDPVCEYKKPFVVWSICGCFTRDRILFTRDRILYAYGRIFSVKIVYFQRDRIFSAWSYTLNDRIFYFSWSYTLHINLDEYHPRTNRPVPRIPGALRSHVREIPSQRLIFTSVELWQKKHRDFKSGWHFKKFSWIKRRAKINFWKQLHWHRRLAMEISHEWSLCDGLEKWISNLWTESNFLNRIAMVINHLRSKLIRYINTHFFAHQN